MFHTIREAYHQASSLLQQHQHSVMQDPNTVAEWLLLSLLGWDRTELFLRWDEPFPEEKREEWAHMLERKLAGEPVQYIIGEQEFYGLSFHVNPAVLIPRPETELLVDHIIQVGQRIWQEKHPILADIGTGSGAMAISIAKACPDWRILATDLSEQALDTARSNALAHHVQQRISFFQGDLLNPLIERNMEIDILVSNPPYIPSAEISKLQPEVQQYEPRLALDGGTDGLTMYRRMIEQMAHLPQYPKLVGFEVGQGQASTVAEWLSITNKWTQIEIIHDLAGIGRHVIAY